MVINRLLLLQRYKHIYMYLFYSGQVVIHVIKIILRNTTNKPPTVIADYVKFNRLLMPPSLYKIKILLCLEVS